MSIRFQSLPKHQQTHIAKTLEIAGASIDPKKPQTPAMRKLNEALRMNSKLEGSEDKLSHVEAQKAIHDFIFDGKGPRWKVFSTSMRSLLATSKPKLDAVLQAAFPGRTRPGHQKRLADVGFAIHFQCPNEYKYFAVTVDLVDRKTGKVSDFSQVVVDRDGRVRKPLSEYEGSTDMVAGPVGRLFLDRKPSKYELSYPAGLPRAVRKAVKKSAPNYKEDGRAVRYYVGGRETYWVLTTFNNETPRTFRAFDKEGRCLTKRLDPQRYKI